MEDLREAKKSLRRQILQQRDALDEKERQRASESLTKRIIAHPLYLQAKVFLGYVNYGSETDTAQLLEHALGSGKKVYVPKIVKSGEKRAMVFYRIESLDELVSGFHGIREPSGTTELFDYCEEQAQEMFLLMPGVAFDRKGYRLGYGGGFYDTFLADKRKLAERSLAICFACQMVDRVPAEPWDLQPGDILFE